MPTTKKTLMFLSSFFTSLGASVVLCAVLGTHEWVSSTIAISDASSNGTIVVAYGLFRGESTEELQGGLAEGDKDFAVLGTLSESSPKTLHSVVILFLVLSLFSSLLSSGLTFYNSISNPYQTFLGPLGVYVWSGLSASLAFLALVLFAGNVQANGLSQELARQLYPPSPASTRRAEAHRYGRSFWLTLLVLLLNGTTVVVVVFFQRARQRRKQEQRKPMEDAPRDGILF